MERLIQDLLALSRVVQRESDRCPVNAYDAAQVAIQQSHALIQESGAEVCVEALPVVLAGEAHLIQVFQNLISNAIKYRRSEAAPRISISARVENEFAVLKVQDNGMGFDPRYSETIFTLFARLHGGRYEGTGLGLAICRRIIDRYGGRIWAESQPEKGSTFFFTLPIARESQQSKR